MSADERARIDAQIAASNRPAARSRTCWARPRRCCPACRTAPASSSTPKINARLKHIEFVNLAPGRALVILVGEDGSVENRVIDVPRGLPPSTFTEASNYLSTSASRARPSTEVQRLVREEMREPAPRARRGLGPHRGSRRWPVWSGDSDPAGQDPDRARPGQSAGKRHRGGRPGTHPRLFDDIENKSELVQLLGLAEPARGCASSSARRTGCFRCRAPPSSPHPTGTRGEDRRRAGHHRPDPDELCPDHSDGGLHGQGPSGRCSLDFSGLTADMRRIFPSDGPESVSMADETKTPDARRIPRRKPPSPTPMSTPATSRSPCSRTRLPPSRTGCCAPPPTWTICASGPSAKRPRPRSMPPPISPAIC